MAILGDSTAISMNVLNTVEAGTIKKRGGTSSQFLMADGSVSTHSGVDKVGTVTSVAVSPGAGISVSGSPITTSGTLTITNTGVRSVTAGSTANVIKVNTNGSEASITINNVAHATSADSATTATSATNATTATNLANKPSLTWTAASSASAGSTLTVTAGGKTSDAITINKVRAAFTADSATKATQDGSGNTITSTYVKKSGDTMTGSLTATSFVKSGGTASQFLMADGTTKTLSTTVSQNNTNPVTSGAVWSFCDEFEEVTATALNYLNLSKQDKLTAGSGIALTQASGSAIISVAGVPREVLSATHAGLVQLRNNNRLVPGQWYRITDYNPTFVGSGAFIHSGALVSGHHRFDILVMATSYNTLAPDAYACRHEGDTYFQHCLLDKWKLKYSLTDPYEDLGLTGIKKYTWCDAATDGGIIYEMIDENNNQCPYDFKNVMIQVYCRINAGYGGDFYEEGDFGPYYGINYQKYYYTFNLRDENYDNFADLSVAVMDPSWGYSTEGVDTGSFNLNKGVDIVCNNTIKPFLSRLADFYLLDTIASLGNTNPGVCQRLNEIVIDYQWNRDSSDTAVIRENVFDNGCHSMFYLPGNDLTTLFFNNYFGKYCHNIIFTDTNLRTIESINIGNECNNIIINSSERISIGDKSHGILIGKSQDITVGRSCYNMSLPEQFLTPDNEQGYLCYFGDECAYIEFKGSSSIRRNVFGCSCNNIALDGCVNNTFGDYCTSINLISASYNRFGNYCSYITCTPSTSFNTFGGRCRYISVRTSSSATYSPSNRSFSYCTFDSNTCYIHLVASTGTGSVQRKHVLCSASGTSTSAMMNVTVSTYAPSATTADMYIGRKSHGDTTLIERSPLY